MKGRESKNRGFFGEDKEHKDPYPCGLIHVPADIGSPPFLEESKYALDPSWEPQLYTKENVREIIQWPRGNKKTFFVIYRDKTLRKFYHNLGGEHILLEETTLAEIPETELDGPFPPASGKRFEYLDSLLEQLKKENKVRSRHAPLDYLPDGMK